MRNLTHRGLVTHFEDIQVNFNFDQGYLMVPTMKFGLFSLHIHQKTFSCLLNIHIHQGKRHQENTHTEDQ